MCKGPVHMSCFYYYILYRIKPHISLGTRNYDNRYAEIIYLTSDGLAWYEEKTKFPILGQFLFHYRQLIRNFIILSTYKTYVVPI